MEHCLARTWIRRFRFYLSCPRRNVYTPSFEHLFFCRLEVAILLVYSAMITKKKQFPVHSSDRLKFYLPYSAGEENEGAELEILQVTRWSQSISYDQKRTDAIAIPLNSIYIQFPAVITVIEV